MSITVNPQTRITMLDPAFVSTINNLLQDTSLAESEVVALNFRDPGYNADSCSGFHSVEIHVDCEQPPAKAGGFGLRLKAGLIGPSAD